jgi:hypothetical protein
METKKAVQRCPNSSPQQKTLNNFNRVWAYDLASYKIAWILI